MSEVEKLIELLEKQIAILKERAEIHGTFDVFIRASKNTVVIGYNRNPLMPCTESLT